jgi:hypothetical protein
MKEKEKTKAKAEDGPGGTPAGLHTPPARA